jgi:hypothetical protein
MNVSAGSFPVTSETMTYGVEQGGYCAYIYLTPSLLREAVSVYRSKLDGTTVSFPNFLGVEVTSGTAQTFDDSGTELYVNKGSPFSFEMLSTFNDTIQSIPRSLELGTATEWRGLDSVNSPLLRYYVVRAVWKGNDMTKKSGQILVNLDVVVADVGQRSMASLSTFSVDLEEQDCVEFLVVTNQIFRSAYNGSSSGGDSANLMSSMGSLQSYYGRGTKLLSRSVGTQTLNVPRVTQTQTSGYGYASTDEIYNLPCPQACVSAVGLRDEGVLQVEVNGRWTGGPMLSGSKMFAMRQTNCDDAQLWTQYLNYVYIVEKTGNLDRDWSKAGRLMRARSKT